jgi:hypothetical protein
MKPPSAIRALVVVLGILAGLGVYSYGMFRTLLPTWSNIENVANCGVSPGAPFQVADIAVPGATDSPLCQVAPGQWTKTPYGNAPWEAHRHCALHADEIRRSAVCGCFYCQSTFAPTEILEWIDDRNVGEGRTGRTALCPKCGIDSVLGDASGFPMTREFLDAMHARWFGS